MIVLCCGRWLCDKCNFLIFNGWYIIINVVIMDFGIYVCIVINGLGSVLK